jgi:Xaa-Pro dipeptidase
MQRRHFLTSVAASAGAVAISSTAPGILRGPPSATRRRAGRTTPATNIEIRTSYPEIAPFGREVFERRIERARSLMREAAATVLVATSGATNFEYLVGRNFGRSERLIALFVPVSGDPIIVAPSFEAERIRRGAKVGTVIPWEEHESPYDITRKALGTAASSSVLLLEPKTEYWTAMRIAGAIPGAKLLDGSDVFERMRLVKRPEEIERMRRATVITEDAIAATLDQLEVGMRDRDIAAIVSREHEKRGVQGGALVQLGAQSALPHGGTIGTALAEGMVVLIDGGCEFEGYASDITRTRWFGDAPPQKFVEMYNLVYDAQTAAMEKVRPGVPCQEIDRAARAVITNGGYGPYFTHRLGHGMGMEGHEPAYMVEGNTRPLEPGFMFSVEPGIYILNEYGVRIEDDYMCTETGGELLSRRPPKV